MLSFMNLLALLICAAMILPTLRYAANIWKSGRNRWGAAGITLYLVLVLSLVVYELFLR